MSTLLAKEEKTIQRKKLKQTTFPNNFAYQKSFKIQKEQILEVLKWGKRTNQTFHGQKLKYITEFQSIITAFI